MKQWIPWLVTALVLGGCTMAEISVTRKGMPRVYVEHNETHVQKRNIRISLFRLANYTDTPDAGLRAANILEGVLTARGYKVIPHYKKSVVSLKKAQKRAKKDKSRYFLLGGVSEWRYKNGIDGEPAVSVRLSLYRTKNRKLVWSATGSDSDWGNASLGTTAHLLFEEMMDED